MVENEFREEIDPIEEQEIQEIFDESGSNLPEPTSRQTQETIHKARRQAGLADCLTLIVRTGRVALHLIGAMFWSQEKSESGEE